MTRLYRWSEGGLALALLSSIMLWDTANAAPRITVEPSTRGLSRQVAPRDGEAAIYNKVYLLVVGVGAYPLESGVPPLAYAIHDARGFRDVVTHQIDVAHVVERLDQGATREGIFEAFRELRALLTERDALIVFWAGHGVSEQLGDNLPLNYFVTYDGSASMNDPSNIAMSEVRQQLSQLPAFHKLLIVDACFAGVLARRAVTPIGSAGRSSPSTYTQRDVFAVLTAGAEGQSVLDGGARGHSAFTGALIERLKTLDGYITASELHLGVRDRVTALANQAGVRQTPLYALIDEREGQRAVPGDFVFVASEAVRLRHELRDATDAWRAARRQCNPHDGAQLDAAFEQIHASEVQLAQRVWLVNGAAGAAATICHDRSPATRDQRGGQQAGAASEQAVAR